MCKYTGVRVCNGRYNNCKTGAFTFVGNNGCIVIDYLLTTECDFDRLTLFGIREFTEFSDHAPLQFAFKTYSDLNTNIEHEREAAFIRWDNSKAAEFRRHLIGKLPILNTLNFHSNTKDAINDTVIKCIDVINSVTDPMFKKSVTSTTPTKGTSKLKEPYVSKDWFDQECYRLQKDYKTVLASFNMFKSDENRRRLQDSKRIYKSYIKRRKCAFHKLKMKDIESLKKKKPKDFWKYFSKRKHKTGDDIDVSAFYEHFSNLTDDINITVDDDAEEFCTRNVENEDPIFEELNGDITSAEVEKAIQCLKRRKAGSDDWMLNEFFLCAGDILLAHLTDLFNMILNTGVFPDKWMEGIIVPLYKNGSTKDVNNYRGITLVSHVAKLFTTIVNNRLTEWCARYNAVSDAQFGFKKGFSTVDAIFSLQCIIEKYMSEGKRLYCIVLI